MIFQVKALQQIVAFLDEYSIPFMIIGGIANAERGRVRATEDADLKILVREKLFPTAIMIGWILRVLFFASAANWTSSTSAIG